MTRIFLITLLLLAVLAGGVPSHATGQSPAAGQPSPSLDAPAQLMLIRNTIALVNHGNLTGNYTVLRDLASVRFRQRNTAADLAATFANLRQQKLDLSPILVIQPQLTQPPEIVGDRLQLAGLFPTRPQAVQFALAFQQVDAGWMIDEIAVRVAPAETRPPPAAPPPSATAAGYRSVPPYAPQPTDIRTAERVGPMTPAAPRPR
jgi:hypothetical protein